MKKAWNSIDLEGGGVQSANLLIQQQMRHRSTAYLLWLLFPLGAHRIYLDSQRMGLLYSALSAITLILWFTTGGVYPLTSLAGLIALALYDLYWIDQQVVALNKALRLNTYLGMGAKPPKEYQGRYQSDDHEEYLSAYQAEKEQELAGVQPVASHEYKKGDRVPSFAEQESLLRELAKTRNRQNDEPT